MITTWLSTQNLGRCRLPENQAIVTDGETITASGGEAIIVGVAAGVPSFTVRSDPFWDPFTMTAGTGANGYGYDAAEGLGTISNQPVSGATVDRIYTPEGDDLEIKLSSDTVPLNNITRASLIGIGPTTYNPSNVTFQQGPDGSVLTIYIAAGSFAWMSGQQVPIVIIP